MIELIETNRQYGNWIHSRTIESQLDSVMEYARCEDYGEISELDLNELVNLFCFLRFVVGVECIDRMREAAEEEEADGDYHIQELVNDFNFQMGHKVIEL